MFKYVYCTKENKLKRRSKKEGKWKKKVKSEHKFLLETSKWVQQSSILKLHFVTQILVVKSSLVDHIDFTRSSLKNRPAGGMKNTKGLRLQHLEEQVGLKLTYPICKMNLLGAPLVSSPSFPSSSSSFFTKSSLIHLDSHLSRFQSVFPFPKQHCLNCSRTVIAIENPMLRNIQYEELIDEFASVNVRRKSRFGVNQDSF
ncbi:hypothetical protein MTR_4g089145 [Medicago truncatula]|uniref:Uncharacterized protein n=1 Tax=Medicago truncatula TaxID=3880 RepID=A0A072UP18_MEDTR|nr:hypothetical protein MTR_4g089145 [Medicago truncatula]